MKTPDKGKYVTSVEAAKILGVTVPELIELMQRERDPVPHVNLAGIIRILEDELRDWLTDQELKRRTEAELGSDDSPQS